MCDLEPHTNNVLGSLPLFTPSDAPKPSNAGLLQLNLRCPPLDTVPAKSTTARPSSSLPDDTEGTSTIHRTILCKPKARPTKGHRKDRLDHGCDGRSSTRSRHPQRATSDPLSSAPRSRQLRPPLWSHRSRRCNRLQHPDLRARGSRGCAKTGGESAREYSCGVGSEG